MRVPLFAFLVGLVSNAALSAATECDDYHRSIGCEKCYESSTKQRPGFDRSGFGLEWTAGEHANEIYVGENKTPVKLVTKYTNGELEVSRTSEQFGFVGDSWQHPKHGTYVSIKRNSSATILKSDPGYFIRFVKTSDEISNDGGKYPLYTLVYRINYWREKQTYEQHSLSSCLSVYPGVFGIK